MKKTLWIFFYIFVACLLLYNSFSYLDPDFGWHLRVGEAIWQAKSVPHDQVYMWTLAGRTWVDHEWLSNLLTFGLWSAGGYPLVAAFFALIPLSVIWLVNRYAQRHWQLSAEGLFLLAGFEVAGLVAMHGHLGIRMQEFTVLFLAILLIIIDTVRRGRWQAMLWTLPLFYFWACLHGGFLIAPVVVAGWLLYEWSVFFFPPLAAFFRASPLPRRQLAILSALGAAATGLTAATPYGIELFTFLSGYRGNYFMDHIQEWLPPYAYPVHYAQLGMITLCLALACWIINDRKPGSWFACLTAGAFAFLSLRATRHFPLLIVAVLVLVAPRAFASLAPRLAAAQRRLLAWLSLVCLIAVSLALVASTRFTADPFSAYCTHYPCGAVRFLRDHPEYARGPLLNHYNFGGFLIGVWPQLPLFIDGRLPQYPLNGTSALEQFELFSDKDRTAGLLDAYGIKTVFFPQSAPPPAFDLFETWILGYGQRPTNGNAVIDYLKGSPDWRLAYEDETSLIFIRNGQK